MSFFSSDNLKKIKGQLTQAAGQAAEAGKKFADQAQDAAKQVQAKYNEVAENPTAAANKMQIQALANRVEQARTNWMSVYLDEMLNDVSNKAAGGTAKGIDLLTSIKDILTLAQPRVKGVKSGEALGEIIINLGKITSSKGEVDVKSLEEFYKTTQKTIADVLSLDTNEKLQDALTKGGKKETFDVLVAGFSYDERCATVLAKCKPGKLATITASPAAEALGVSALDVSNTDATKTISASVKALGKIADKAAALSTDLTVDQSDAIYNLSEDICTYNLSMSVSSNAMAYASHYGAQLTNGAKAIAGQALGWIAKKNKGNNLG